MPKTDNGRKQSDWIVFFAFYLCKVKQDRYVKTQTDLDKQNQWTAKKSHKDKELYWLGFVLFVSHLYIQAEYFSVAECFETV